MNPILLTLQDYGENNHRLSTNSAILAQHSHTTLLNSPAATLCA